MADQASTSEQHIFRLSTLDQGAPREYHTVAFTYPLDHVHAQAVATRFLSAIKILLSWIPLLAGELRTASGRDGAERGHLEVAVSLDMIAAFTATVVNLQAVGLGYGYDVLRGQRFPSRFLGIEQFAQLPATAAAVGAKAFGAQLSIISGGAVVVLQLHRAVGDLAAFSQIVRCLTETTELKALTHDALSALAVRSSKGRDLLSADGGVLPLFGGVFVPPPGLQFGEILTQETVSVVLGFKPAIIDQIVDTINTRNVGPDYVATRLPVTPFAVLAAILWRAVVRARMAAGLLHPSATHDINPPFPNSRVLVPVNVRERLQPELKANFFGNAAVAGTASQSIVALNMPIGVSEIASTAPVIREAVGGVNDHQGRREIATIKTKRFDPTNDETDLSIASERDLVDVTITSWSDALHSSCTLNLGLGEPTFTRKLTGPTTKDDITIHARPSTDTKKPDYAADDSIWEATITINAAVRQHLLEDEGALKFVQLVDGVRYINGRPELMELDHQLALVQEAERRQAREMRGRWQRGLAIAGPSGAAAGMGGQ